MECQLEYDSKASKVAQQYCASGKVDNLRKDVTLRNSRHISFLFLFFLFGRGRKSVPMAKLFV